MPDRCNHPNFAATVNIARIEDKGRFMADVTVRCTECSRPFQFLGLQPGVDMQGARCSVDGLEARLAICPQGETQSPMDAIAVSIGFAGKHHG